MFRFHQWVDLQDPQVYQLNTLETVLKVCSETISEFWMVDQYDWQPEEGHVVVLGWAVEQYQVTHSWDWEMLKIWWVGLWIGEGSWEVVGDQVLHVFGVGWSGGVPTHHLSYLKQF